MDARLDPVKYAGLAEGGPHVIRNAGGRASGDAIRSLIISYKLLGTREWFVVRHTDCGMQLLTNDDMRNLLASSLKTVTLDQSGWRDSGEGSGSPGVRVEARCATRGTAFVRLEPDQNGLTGGANGFEPLVPR
jgi:carbonic anhydrase